MFGAPPPSDSRWQPGARYQPPKSLEESTISAVGITPDWKLTEATIKRAREALRLLRVKGVVRIVGGPVLKRCRWVLVER